MLTSLLLIATIFAADSPPTTGTITGTVIDLSNDRQPASQVEVVLRAELDDEDQMITVAATHSDDGGQFTFSDIPLEMNLTLQPGAEVDGVHYPGPRVQITPSNAHESVQLTVRQTLAEPNPLVIQQHEVIITPTIGALHVTEAVLVENPTEKTYVGKTTAEGNKAGTGGMETAPVTFTLGIPTNFLRLTFEKEAFGKAFSLENGTLVTHMPWEPGEKLIRFTYSLRNEQEVRRWQRAMDARCNNLVIRVHHEAADEVACNLNRVATSTEGEITYQSGGTEIPAGQMVHVDIGQLPIPWMAYARWAALILLGVAIAAMAIWSRRSSASSSEPKPTQRQPVPPPHLSASRGRKKRRQRTAAKRH